MLDNITGGWSRVSCAGSAPSHHSWGANPAWHDHCHEAHDLILRRPVPTAAAAISIPRLARDDQMGLAPGPQIHLPADLQPGRGAGALRGASRESAKRYGYEATAHGVGRAGAALIAQTRSRSARPRSSSSSTRVFACHRRECPYTRLYLRLASIRVMARRALDRQPRTWSREGRVPVRQPGDPAREAGEVPGQDGLRRSAALRSVPAELTRKSSEPPPREVIPHFRARDAAPARAAATA